MERSADSRVKNVFSVDVEEYFQVEAFSGYIKKENWDQYPRRIQETIDRLLEILSSNHVKGTFFVLGWLAERNPGLVRKISAGGHEIASHGYEHTMVTRMSPEELRSDVRKSKIILEDIVGSGVTGYRAPTFSIVERTSWAYEILMEEGYRYSSSVFPVMHDRYGWVQFGDAPRRMFEDGGKDIWEIPMSVWALGPFRIPFGGGGYLRSYPLFVTRALFRLFSEKGRPVIFYVHPWELDSRPPQVEAPVLRRIRHYFGIEKTERKLIDLLQTETFGTFSDVFADLCGGS